MFWALPTDVRAVDCQISATDHAFGTYDPTSSVATDSTSDVTVKCLLAGTLVETSYTITLSTGASGNYSERTLESASDVLGYNLYVDSTRTTIWGDGSGDSATVSNTAQKETHTVYGRLFAGQYVAAGSYSDTIIATVQF